MKCSVDFCDRDVKTKGYCKGHYMQQYLGKPFTPLRPRRMRDYSKNLFECRRCGLWKDGEEFRWEVSAKGSNIIKSECRKCEVVRAQQDKQRRLAQGIPCSIWGCGKPVLNKGLCTYHYGQDYHARVSANES